MSQATAPQVAETSIESFSKFVELFHNKKGEHGVIWRGQRDASWQLEPSILRLVNQRPKTDLDAAQHRGLKSFQNSEPFLHSLRLSEGEMRAWAIGQHHGLRTPLLDWTRSPYVALFFACAQLRLQIPNQDWPQAIAAWSLNINEVERERGIVDTNWSSGQYQATILPIGDYWLSRGSSSMSVPLSALTKCRMWCHIFTSTSFRPR